MSDAFAITDPTRDEIYDTDYGADDKVCDACTDHFETSSIFNLSSCTHAYCEECLSTMISAAVGSSLNLPPQCCGQPLGIASTRSHLPQSLYELFREMEIQESTSEKLYCSTPLCSTLLSIPNADATDPTITTATCSACGARTCIKCRGPAHPQSLTCPEDKDLSALLDLAAETGWTRCPTCRSVVELDTGCYHITYVTSPATLLSLVFSPNVHAASSRYSEPR